MYSVACQSAALATAPKITEGAVMMSAIAAPPYDNIWARVAVRLDNTL